MKIRLENPREYTALEVHGALMRATESHQRYMADLGDRYMRGETSENMPEWQRTARADERLIVWALGQIWDGMATAERESEGGRSK